MGITKRCGASVKCNRSAISKAIMNAMKQTAKEIDVRKSALHHLVYEVVGAQIEKRLETTRKEIESQISDLRDRLRKLRAFYNSMIYGKDSSFSRFLNFLTRIWSRAKATIEVILLIKGVYETIIIVQNFISTKKTSLSAES